MTHPSHQTRYSDSSLYAEVCKLCGGTDAMGSTTLDEPCMGVNPNIHVQEHDPYKSVSDTPQEKRLGTAGLREYIEILEKKGISIPVQIKIEAGMIQPYITTVDSKFVPNITNVVLPGNTEMITPKDISAMMPSVWTVPLPVIKIKAVDGTKTPVYATDKASGADIHAFTPDSPIVISPMTARVIPTGLFVELPVGYEVQVRSRSGLAAKNNLFVLNSPGTIDNDYRGEIKVILYNLGQQPFVVENGDRIAQMVIAPYIQAKFEIVNELTNTSRGQGGFGSTGV